MGLREAKLKEQLIRKQMEEKEGEEIKDKISKLKEIEDNSCLREGGSSSQSLDGLVNHIYHYKATD